MNTISYEVLYEGPLGEKYKELMKNYDVPGKPFVWQVRTSKWRLVHETLHANRIHFKNSTTMSYHFIYTYVVYHLWCLYLYSTAPFETKVTDPRMTTLQLPLLQSMFLFSSLECASWFILKRGGIIGYHLTPIHDFTIYEYIDSVLIRWDKTLGQNLFKHLLIFLTWVHTVITLGWYGSLQSSLHAVP